MMKSLLLLLLLLTTTISFSRAATTDTCAKTVLPANRPPFTTCTTLPKLSASLHWTYHPSNGTLDIAYRAQQSSSGYVAWGLNPTSTGMLNSEVLIAFPSSDGTLTVYSTKLTSYQPNISNTSLSFPVYSRSADYTGGFMTIYANIQLPKNGTKVNQVWQAGPVTGGLPGMHATTGDNVLSRGSLDFLSGQSTVDASGNRLKRKNTHGVLNAVSWGVLMPMGAIIARYMRVFMSADPAWFYLHIACQLSGYIVGVAGWGTGLKLGSESVGVEYDAHRSIGIVLFSLATLQIFALLLRPNKDNKYRIYWNVYHHAVGYTVIVLSVINIYKGLDILDPEKKWKKIYTAIIIVLAAIAVVLEAVTWAIVLKRKSSSTNPDKSRANGANGHGFQNQGV